MLSGASLGALVDVVQIIAQELVHNEERLAVVEDVEKGRQQLPLLCRDSSGQELQELYLPQILVEDVLRHQQGHRGRWSARDNFGLALAEVASRMLRWSRRARLSVLGDLDAHKAMRTTALEIFALHSVAEGAWRRDVQQV